MSKSWRTCLSLPLLAVLAGAPLPHGAIAADAARAAQNQREPIRLHAYSKADGANYFALSLTPSSAAANQAAQTGADIVVLFDTSASQVGKYREKALEALATMVGGLGERDRVHLMAVDLDGVAMTKSFAAPSSKEMAAALSKLKQRTPLGATDLIAGLTTADAAFDAKSNQRRAVVYIGDGVTNANISAPKRMAGVLANLAKHEVAVTCMAIGPKRDDLMLAAIANQTGGMLALDGHNFSAAQAGKYLASAATGVVAWPVAVQWPVGAEVLPARPIPFRFDRDTIYIDSGKLAEGQKIDMTARIGGVETKLSWTMPAANVNKDNAFLPRIVETARADHGASLSTLGSDGLRMARDISERNVDFLADQVRQAVASGNLRGARPMLDELARIDPRHPDLAELRASLTKQEEERAKSDAAAIRSGKARGAAETKRRSPFMLVAYQPDAAPKKGDAGDTAAIDQAEQDRRRANDVIAKETEVLINESRRIMATNPQKVKDDMKLQLDFLDRAPDLYPETRAQLIDKVTAVVRQAESRAASLDDENAEKGRQEGARAERERITLGLIRNQEKVKQLTEQFRVLLADGNYDEADESVAAHIEKIYPDSALSTSTREVARATDAYRTWTYVYGQHVKRYNQEILQVDTSGIPFPDNVPIIYPDAEVWQDLTNRRRQYASIDLQKKGSAEEKIFRALEEPADFELIQVPLSQFSDTIEQNHHIQVEIDKKALQDASIDPEATEITRNLKGISLRSALRLILSEFELKYIIKDEVLMITTAEKAQAALTTKVYPVADLVLKIKDTGFQGGFSGLGNFGNLNGGGNDAGGGGLGGGGGQQGGGAF